jgi:acetolactate synthase-1/2/3 large subunit
VIGDHATHHKPYDAPLTSDVEALARPLCHFVRTTTSAEALARDAAEAVAAARTAPGQIAALILPADVSWSEALPPAPPVAIAPPRKVDEARVKSVASALRSGKKSALLVSGPALRERGLLFVGIDVIDGNLTEINVTCPTGIRAIAKLGGPDVAAKIWDTIEKKRGAK